MKSLDTVRIIRCPACGHNGTIGKLVPTTARLSCRSCGVKVQLRYCIPGQNNKPCRWRPPSAAKTAKDAAARDVLKRYGGEVPDDRLDDLWTAG